MLSGNNPLISVCIVNYNQGRFFADALNSYLSQTYKELELIIIDDCSTDDSVEIIKKLLDEKQVNARFIINPKNQGVCKNMNLGISLSNGKYFSVVASDDYFGPQRYEKLINATRQVDDSYKLFYSNCKMVDEKGAVLENDFIRFYRLDISQKDGNIFRELLKGNFIPAIALLIRKDAFDSVGLFDESLRLEDYDMWLRIARQYNLKYVEDDEVYYRQLNNSLLRNLQKGSSYYQEHFNVLFKHIGFMDKKTSKEVLKQLYNLYKSSLKRTKHVNWSMTNKLIFAFFKTL